MNPLRSLILAAAANDRLRSAVTTLPVSRAVVRRFVAGTEVTDALRVVRELTAAGLWVSVDHLGEHAGDAASAEHAVQAYLQLLDRLHAEGLAGGAEVSVKLSALCVHRPGERLDEVAALRGATRICAAAEQAGTTVTLDAEDHTTTDTTLRVLAELRRTWPATGTVLQSCLRRTEADCRTMARNGCRVRLCKGAYAEPGDVAFVSAHEVDRSYVRCMEALLDGDGYPMFATHDPRLLRIIDERVRRRGFEQFEYQMLYGVRPDEQRRLARTGAIVRIYLPYGADWYGYLVRRLAERPANVGFLLRSLVSTR